MRIVHVSPGYWPVLGGSEVHIQEVSERLARRGHDVTVLTPAHNATSRPKVEVLNGVRVVRFREHRFAQQFADFRGGWRTVHLLLRADHARILLRGPLSLGLLTELLSGRPDVVASIGWWAGLLPLQIGIAKKFRRFQSVGLPLFHTEEAWSREPVYSHLLRGCDALVANTSHERDYMISLGCRPGSVHVVGVGVDPTRLRVPSTGDLRQELGLSNAPVVGFLGRVVPSKGVPRLIEAMQFVWNEEPAARLVLAGRRAPRGSAMDQQIESALGQLSELERSRVRELGEFREEDKARILSAFDVLAMPSKAESFGIAYIEAWFCGKPVLGSRTGSTPSVIDDGVDGLLVDPDNPRDIAESLVRLLKNPQLREHMGLAGREKTLTRYTWEKVTDRLESVYRGLTSN